LTTHPSLGQARKAARIRKVVEDVMARRAAGETVADSDVIGRNPDLMPELSRELAALGVLERAWNVARTRSTSSASNGPRQGQPPVPPDSFEGYELSGQVHRGGQGLVYEATQKSTGRRVAIKVMREGLFAGDGDAARFEREVRILGQIDHPGVVSILASGVHTGHFFYVMELLTGLTLDRFAAERCADVRERLRVFLKVCAAVSAAHLRGIIHRDLKPANIIVDDQGQPRILDFGLARITAEWAQSRRATHTGQFVGSMPWASPEQAAGDPSKIDLRTDVYSLGVILYEILTGRFPYRVEGGPRDVLDQILTAEPTRPRSLSRAIDEDLEAIVLKCLAKERERRYQSAAELADDVRRHLERQPVLARPPSTVYQLRIFVRRHRALVVGAAAVLATLVLGLLGTSVGLLEASSGRHAAELARDAARDAEATAVQHFEEAQRGAYVASVMAADSAVHAMDAGAARARLDAAPLALRDWEWRYLAHRTDLSVAVLDTPAVHHAAVSPAGDTLAALGTDGSLMLLDAATREVRWRTEVPHPHRSAVEQEIACFSADGSMLATGHGDAVLVWRVGRPTPVATLSFPPLRWGWINAVFNADCTLLAANGRNGAMMIWDLRTGQPSLTFTQDVPYWGIDWMPGGRSFLVGTTGGAAELDAQTGAMIRMIPIDDAVGASSAAMLRIAPSGEIAALPTRSGIAVIDLSAGRVRTVLRGHTQQVTTVAFSADSLRLASTGWDRTVRIWNLETGTQERAFWGHGEEVTGIGFALNDSRIITAGADGPIRYWDPHSIALTPALKAGPPVFGMLFDPRGDRLAALQLGAIQIWTPASGGDPLLPAIQPSQFCMGSLSTDWTMMSAGHDDGTTTVSDPSTGRIIWTAPDPRASPSDPPIAPSHHTFSPDSKILATLTVGGKLHLWDARSGALLHSLERGTHDATPIHFNADGRLVASPAGDEVRVWECATGRLAATLQEPQGPRREYTCLAFSADGRLIATGDTLGVATVWDARTYRPLRHLSGMKPTVWSVAFNPAGTRLATGSQDRMARIWNPATGEELLVLRGHTGSVISLAWSPDGNTLASGSYDEFIRIWRAGEPPKPQ